MSDRTAECPSAEVFAAYLRGRLDDEASAAVEEHYLGCEKCGETLRVVDGDLGTVVVSPPADPFEDEAACERAVAIVEELGRHASEPTRLGAVNVEPTVDSPGRGDVGHYRLLEKLGQGGMGTVFKALHTKLDRVVALKILSQAALRDPAAVDRFEREMRAVGKLRHANIVGAHDAGEADGVHYLVMELVEGADLGSLVERHGPLPVPEACELVRQAALGLDHAHRHGLVHRDVKPSNLMLDREGVVKVLDMGLARLGESTGELTATGQLMGTLEYMAPEQASDTAGVDVRADVYALGATLYKLLCGTAPFAGRGFDTPIQKLRALEVEEPEPLAARRTGLPPALGDLVHRMLSKDPADRPESLAELAEALGDFATGADVGRLLEGPPAGTEEEPAITEDVQLTVHRPAPSPPASAALWWSRGPVQATIAGVVLLPLFVYLVATTFFVQTEYGVIRIEVEGADADDVEVSVRGTDVVLTGADEKPVRLSPGEKSLHVRFERGDVSFNTSAIDLKPKDDLTVRIEFRPGEIVALRGDTRARIGGAERPGERPAANPDEPVVRNDVDDPSRPPLAVAPFQAGPAREYQAAWAKHFGEDVETTNSIGTKLVLVPPGRFTLNEPIAGVEAELPEPYRIGAHEVTQREWRSVMGTEPWKGQENVLEQDDVPATHVNFLEATEFCVKLSEREHADGSIPEDWEYRLPTEAEWEFACRAGSKRFFWFNNYPTELSDHAWYQENAEGQHAHPVGRKKPNPWGVYDMHGNVREWVYNVYAVQPLGGTNPTGPEERRFEGNSRTIRNGSWDGHHSACGSHFRKPTGSFSAGETIGFRIALVRSIVDR